MLVGHVQEITRHPVKSFTGEQVQKTKVMGYGLYGDRSHAFKDKNGKFLTITQVPEMVRYQAVFSGEEALDHYPEIQVKTPSGNVLTWGDTAFQEEMDQLLKQEASFVEYSPAHIPWFGKRLQIGDHVELEIKRHCERCMIITVDPTDSKRDTSLLKTVVKERKNHFGVYASVIRTGEISLGDQVFLKD
ncbi:MOSC domain-containing protein [Peribacillus butanolivorans]|uniref:MOSC domain-containing protein n=1 Tax=Peribacillus butanolivorans TaxID=421767 RepID=UPI0035DFC7FA